MEGAVQQTGCHFHSAAAWSACVPERKRKPTRSDGNFPFFDAPRPPPPPQSKSLLFLPFFLNPSSPFLILLVPPIAACLASFSFLPPLLSPEILVLLVIPSKSFCLTTFTCPPPSPALLCRVLPNVRQNCIENQPRRHVTRRLVSCN